MRVQPFISKNGKHCVLRSLAAVVENILRRPIDEIPSPSTLQVTITHGLRSGFHKSALRRFSRTKGRRGSENRKSRFPDKHTPNRQPHTNFARYARYRTRARG